MKNQITVDSKIGYYNPKKGRYQWATIVGFGPDTVKLERKEGRYLNTWEEKTSNIVNWLKTPSPDWHGPIPRMLLKHKGTNRNYSI